MNAVGQATSSDAYFDLTGLTQADRKLVWCFDSDSIPIAKTVSLFWAGRSMTTTAAFQTPPRILIPKLVRSRDAWKAKATERKRQRKALEIRVRDLEASRDRHRQRVAQLQQRLAQLEEQLAAARRPVPAPTATPQKKSTGPAADTTTASSSTSP